jgi:hypothetical protein
MVKLLKNFQGSAGIQCNGHHDDVNPHSDICGHSQLSSFISERIINFHNTLLPPQQHGKYTKKMLSMFNKLNIIRAQIVTIDILSTAKQLLIPQTLTVATFASVDNCEQQLNNFLSSHDRKPIPLVMKWSRDHVLTWGYILDYT